VSKEISIPDILGTEKGLTALSRFIENTGAFTKTGGPRAEPLPPGETDSDAEAETEEDEVDVGGDEVEGSGSEGDVDEDN
jgi:hypothetical protein